MITTRLCSGTACTLRDDRRSARSLSGNCASPAPLAGDPNGGRFIVTFKDSVSVDAEIERLSSVYSIDSPRVLYILPGFVAELGAPVVASLRCEPSIEAIEQDQAVGGA